MSMYSKLPLPAILIFSFVLHLTPINVSTVKAQRLWGDLGVILAQYNIYYTERSGGINPLGDGGHSLMREAQYTHPWSPVGDWLELIYDEDGDFVDSLRYPKEVNDSRLYAWKEAQDGGRIAAFYLRKPEIYRVVKFDEDFDLSWIYTSERYNEPFLHSGYSYVATMLEVDDTILFLRRNPEGFLIADWINSDDGTLICSVQLTGYPALKHTARNAENNYVKIAALSFQQDPETLEEITIESGEDEFDLTRLTGEADYTFRIWYYNNLLTRVYSDTADNYYASVYDSEGEEIDTDLLQGRPFCITNSRLPQIYDRFWTREGTTLQAYQASGNGIRSLWNQGPNVDYAYAAWAIPNGNLILRPDHYGYYLAKVSANGYESWTFDPDNWFMGQCVFATPEVIYMYTAPPYNRRNRGHRVQLRIRTSSGSIIEAVDDVLEYDYQKIRKIWLTQGSDENPWLVWLNEDGAEDWDVRYRYYVCEIETDQVPGGPNQMIPLAERGGSLYQLTSPASDGGLWLAGTHVQKMSPESEPLFDEPVPLGLPNYSYPLFFDAIDDEEPYPFLFEHRQSYPYMGHVKLGFIDENGQFENADFTLRSIDYHSSELFYDFHARRVEDRILYNWLTNRYDLIPVYGVLNLDTLETIEFMDDRQGAVIDQTILNDHAYTVIFRSDHDIVEGHTIGDVYLEDRSLDDPGVVNEYLLAEEVYVLHEYDYGDWNFSLNNHVIFMDDWLIIASLVGEETASWRLHIFDYEGEILADPVDVFNANELNIIDILPVSDDEFWVMTEKNAIPYMRNLLPVEGSEDGIVFSLVPLLSLPVPSGVVADNGDLIVMRNPEGSILLQRIQWPDFNNSGNKSISPAFPFFLSSTWPNPFNSATRFTYSIPHTGAVKLKVFDLLGREVAVLIEGMQQAGRYQTWWNGTSANGNIVASGSYYLQLTSGSRQTVRQVVIIR